MVGSYLLAAFNLLHSQAFKIFNFIKPLNFLLKVLSLPILPFVLILQEYLLEVQLLFCDRGNLDLNREQYKEIKAQTSAFIRTELGNEATPQLMLSLLILLVSSSTTRTVHGLELFNELEEDVHVSKAIEIPAIFIIVVANIWTLISSWTSYIRCLSATKTRFPFPAQAILGLYVSIAVMIKISSCILFLMPALGIGNCLRHLQGERYPYWSAIGFSGGLWGNVSYSVNVTSDVVYFSNITFPWSELTRFDYSDESNPIPPDVTLYTQFELETYLISFWFLLILQALLVIVAKEITNPKVFEKLSWNVVLTNALENVWIQAPLQDWDDEHSSIPDYKKRQKCVTMEMGFAIFINMIISTVMLVPIWILRKINDSSIFLLTNKFILLFLQKTM